MSTEYERYVISELAPQLYWSQNDVSGAEDLSENGNTGTANGGVIIGGASGSPLFDDNSCTQYLRNPIQYISSNYNPFIVGGSITIMGWVMFEEIGIIESIWGASGTNSVTFFLNATNWAWSTNGGVNTVSFTPLPAIAINQWYHVAISFNDTANTVKLHVNTRDQKPDVYTTAYIGSPGNFQLGTTGSTPSLAFKGRSAHASVFTRELAADEVQKAYAFGLGYSPNLEVGNITVTNNGNYKAQPAVSFHGAINNPALENTTTGESIELTNPVSSVDAIIVDSQADTVKDINGLNQFSEFGFESEMIELLPGTNHIKVDNDFNSSDTNGRIEIKFKDAWI